VVCVCGCVCVWGAWQTSHAAVGSSAWCLICTLHCTALHRPHSTITTLHTAHMLRSPAAALPRRTPAGRLRGRCPASPTAATSLRNEGAATTCLQRATVATAPIATLYDITYRPHAVRTTQLHS
jgi:hypothetical protein